jgi:hypothetical protein
MREENWMDNAIAIISVLVLAVFICVSTSGCALVPNAVTPELEKLCTGVNK